MARWKYVVIGLVVVPMLALGLFVGWVWAAFSGGVDDMFDPSSPEPTDPEVVAAERAAEDQVSDVSDEVTATLGRALAPADVVEVGGGAGEGVCYVGQHNFKIDDDFDLSCELRGVRVVSAPSASGMTDRRQLDDALRAAGWWPAGTRDLDAPAQGSPTYAGSTDLGPLRYTSHRDGLAWELVLDEADGEVTSELRMPTYAGELRDAAGRTVSLEQLVGAAPREGYAVVVGVSVEYFRD